MEDHGDMLLFFHRKVEKFNPVTSKQWNRFIDRRYKHVVSLSYHIRRDSDGHMMRVLFQVNQTASLRTRDLETFYGLHCHWTSYYSPRL